MDAVIGYIRNALPEYEVVFHVLDPWPGEDNLKIKSAELLFIIISITNQKNLGNQFADWPERMVAS